VYTINTYSIMKSVILAMMGAVALANTNADDKDKIFGDAEQWKTGIVKIDKRDDMFYWMFESRQAQEDPLVMWLTGGPGCASEVALFYENGPYKFAQDGSIGSNTNSWNEISNLLFVD
jgi:carboxypeptidase C (cathepsin A)